MIFDNEGMWIYIADNFISTWVTAGGDKVARIRIWSCIATSLKKQQIVGTRVYSNDISS